MEGSVTVGPVVPVLAAAVAGIVVGALRRPLGAHLRDPVVLMPALAVGAVALQATLGWFSTEVSGPLLGLSLFLLTGFALLNHHLVGMGVLAVGLALNTAVVLANGAMPVRPEAVVRAGIVEPRELITVDVGAGRRFERTGDWLPVLGDVIPVRAAGAAMSFGDLIVLIGVGTVAGDLTRYARREPRRPRRRSGLLAAGRQRFAAQVIGQDRVGGEAVRVGDGLLHGQELDRGGHVVHPEHGLGDGRGDRADGGEGAGVALAGRGARQRADEVLPGQREQQRPAELGHAIDPVDQVEGLPGGLGEVDAGIEEHLLR